MLCLSCLFAAVVCLTAAYGHPFTPTPCVTDIHQEANFIQDLYQVRAISQAFQSRLLKAVQEQLYAKLSQKAVRTAYVQPLDFQ